MTPAPVDQQCGYGNNSALARVNRSVCQLGKVIRAETTRWDWEENGMMDTNT